MERPFTRRTALVTGASRGIGRAIALAYAAHGGAVALLGRDREALALTAQEATRCGVRAEAFAVDLSRQEELARVPDRVRAAFGRLDALIHAAGAYATGAGSSDPLDLHDELWRINTRAPLALSLASLDMLRTSAGDIVFVNSSVVSSAAPEQPAYAASKRGLAAIADSLRARVNEMGIRVLSIYPGRTATPMQQRIFEQEGRDYRPEQLLQPEDVAAVVVRVLELPRTAEVTDVHIRPFRKPV